MCLEGGSMDNFNFNLFKYFYYVVIYNGVTKASKNLSVAQPSLSLSIKNLELQLKATLIDRTCKQFTLTEEGRQLFELIKPFFENIEKNVKFLNNNKKYVEINIGIRYNYAKPLLADFIRDFRCKNPNVVLNIDLYSKLNFNKFKDNEYDVVIDDDDYIRQLEDAQIENLYNIDNCFICGSKLFDDYQNVRSIHEIEEVPFAAFRPCLKNGKFKQFCYQNNVSFTEIFNINESDLYFQLIKDNLCIGFSNKLLLNEYLNDKSIHIINIIEPIFKDILSIAYKKDNKLTEEFIASLKKYIDGEMK